VHDISDEIVPRSKLDFCNFVSLGLEISPIQIAASSFISDCNIGWKVKIEKTTVQEGRDEKKIIDNTYLSIHHIAIKI